ncbi:glycosyltransferase [Laceyella putida]|uniref:Glycosyltransferase n=1 Tax=Laceyella putida TaxID=110101 RepID=A0ABW2RL16_9BACL
MIIYPPLMDWNWMKQRPQQLMSRLAKQGHVVYYCNRTQTDRAPEEIEPNLTLVHHHQNWLRSDWPKLRKRYDSVGVWCNNPMLANTLSSYQADWIVYDCADDFGEWIRHEKEMVAIADAIVCSSQRLFLRLQKTFPHKRLVLIRNGYDPEMNLHKTEKREIPVDLMDEQNNKLIGYVGAWAPWIDEALVRKISCIDPAWKVVVIGAEFQKKFHHNGLPHVRYLGLKPHQLLPSYIQAFSVCVIPFRLNPITLATNPVKAYEYLAAGKPVIATDLPECRLMRPHVDIAPTHDQFIEKIKKRIFDPGDPCARIEYALQNTWETRSLQAEALLSELI